MEAVLNYLALFNVFFFETILVTTILAIYLTDAQQETNGCNVNCSSEYSPVCAINDKGDTKQFPSECVMKSENCLNKSSKSLTFLLAIFPVKCQIFIFRLYFQNM